MDVCPLPTTTIGAAVVVGGLFCSVVGCAMLTGLFGGFVVGCATLTGLFGGFVVGLLGGLVAITVVVPPFPTKMIGIAGGVDVVAALPAGLGEVCDESVFMLPGAGIVDPPSPKPK